MPRLAVFTTIAMLSGCIAHQQGLVETRHPGIWIQSFDGHETQLVLTPELLGIFSELGGLIVEVDGRKVGPKFAVRDWTVSEGAHGLQTWVGVLERRGIQIGLQDRNSGAFYLVSPKAVETLSPYVGKPVLIEGYVEGAHQVAVVYYRPLFKVEGD